jgi:hypothetical protein
VRALAALGVSTMLVLAVSSACGTKADPVAAGGECFLATDCAPGLVCVEQSNKTRVCSDDLTRVAGRPPEAEGDAGEASDAPAGETSRPDTGGGTPDTGTPPQDSGGD